MELNKNMVSDSLTYKICSKCGKKKDIASFYKYKLGEKIYFRGVCKKCWHKQIVVLKKEYRKFPRGFYYAIKAGAKVRNITFQITKDEFIKWWNSQEMKCFYCKRTLQETTNDNDRINKKSNRLTIDRINNKKSYIVDNIVLCCLRCNFIKGDFFNKEEMLKIGKIIHKNFKKKKMLRIERDIAAHPKNTFDIVGRELTEKDKKIIDEAVKKTFEEYGEVLKLFGRE